MKPFGRKLGPYIKSLAESLTKWRWAILALIGLSLLWVEIIEFRVFSVMGEPFHYVEVFQYAALLTATGVLIELFARSNRAYKQAVKVLEYKHRLSLDLTSDNDPNSLIAKLTELPARIANVEETYLLVNNPLSGKFEEMGHWIAKTQSPHAGVWDPLPACAGCQVKNGNERTVFRQCRSEESFPLSSIYCLGLRGENIPITVLVFRLAPGGKLSEDDERVFENIGDEIIAAIQANRDRERLIEMQSAQVAMAERRSISSFVHDQLGQNLGYLQLKLDQLSADEKIKSAKNVWVEMQRLREIANESYEIVRDILKKIQPETIPHLTNLLKEHARIVSHRANFALDFDSVGKPVPLTPGAQQLIFFTFREILSNVEKHANASKVDVLVVWNNGILDITVSDNGRGFDADAVPRDEHFGLAIMQERIANIKGKFAVTSSTGSGTVVSISVPLDSIMVTT